MPMCHKLSSSQFIIFFLWFSLAPTALSSSISSEVDNLGLKLKLYTNTNNTVYLNGIKNVIEKNAHDAAGTTASFKLLYFDSYDLRVNFYIKNLTQLIEMEYFTDSISDISNVLNRIDDLSVFNKASNTAQLGQIVLELKENRDFLRLGRKMGWSKHANLRWVKARMTRLANGLDEISKIFEKADLTIKISTGIFKIFVAMELETGLLLERLNIISDKFSGSQLNDPAFDEAVQTLTNSLETKSNSFYERLKQAANLRTMDGTLDELVYEVIKTGTAFVIGKVVWGVLQKAGVSSGKINIITLAAIVSIDELLHEFKEAPINVIDHYILSTLLAQGYEINPVNGKKVGQLFAHKNYNTYEELLNAQLKAYLLYLFYDNLIVVMEDTGLVDLILTVPEYLVYGGEFIDRSHTIKTSENLKTLGLTH